MVWWQILLLPVAVGFLTIATLLVGIVAWIAVSAARIRARIRRQHLATRDPQ